MSYRLINSNEIAIKYPEVNDMPCIYVDIPNGLNGDFYDLSIYPKIVENLEQPIVDVLEQIRDEISAILTNSYDEGVKEKALQIIDKYTQRDVRMRNRL